MTRTRARSMATAPVNGTIVLVRHGLTPDWIEAFWSASMQAWVTRDLLVLHHVTAWRPLI
jgi:hypothetical protein